MKVFPQNQSQRHSSRSPRLLGVIRSKYDEFVIICFVCRSNYDLFHVSRIPPDLFKGNKNSHRLFAFVMYLLPKKFFLVTLNNL